MRNYLVIYWLQCNRILRPHEAPLPSSIAAAKYRIPPVYSRRVETRQVTSTTEDSPPDATPPQFPG